MEQKQVTQAYLSQVPRLLDHMQLEGMLTSESMHSVLEALKHEAKNTKTRFVGDLLVDLKITNEKTGEPITRDEVRGALRDQSLRKVEAAILDIQAICRGETLCVPNWLTAQWGNGGVNYPVEEITLEDALSAAATMAQNLVLLSHQSPHIAEGAQTVVLALSNLARGLANGDSARVPIAKRGQEWLETVKEFSNLAEASGEKLEDNAGKEVDLKEYTAARIGEIGYALANFMQKTAGTKTQSAISK